LTHGLLTTSVGSFPKAAHVQQARNQFAQGKLPARELEELEKQATRDWIAFQEGIGMAIRKEVLKRRGALAHAAIRPPGGQLDAPTREALDRVLRWSERPIAALRS